MSISDDKQSHIIDAFNTASSYLDNILNKIILILTIWLVKYTLQSFNLIKPIPLKLVLFLD